MHFDEDQHQQRALGADHFWQTITQEMWDGKEPREPLSESFGQEEASGGRTSAASSEARSFTEPGEVVFPLA